MATYVFFLSVGRDTPKHSNLFMPFFPPSFLFVFFRQILLRARQEWCPGSIPAEIMTAASSWVWGFSCVVLVPWTNSEAEDRDASQGLVGMLGTRMCPSPARHRKGGRQGSAEGSHPGNSS